MKYCTGDSEIERNSGGNKDKEREVKCVNHSLFTWTLQHFVSEAFCPDVTKVRTGWNLSNFFLSQFDRCSSEIRSIWKDVKFRIQISYETVAVSKNILIFFIDSIECKIFDKRKKPQSDQMRKKPLSFMLLMRVTAKVFQKKIDNR